MEMNKEDLEKVKECKERIKMIMRENPRQVIKETQEEITEEKEMIEETRKETEI